MLLKYDWLSAKKPILYSNVAPLILQKGEQPVWLVNAYLAHPSPTALHLDELSRVRDSRFSLFSTLAGVCFYRQAWSTNTISISSVNLSKNSRISVQNMIKPKQKVKTNLGLNNIKKLSIVIFNGHVKPHFEPFAKVLFWEWFCKKVLDLMESCLFLRISVWYGHDSIIQSILLSWPIDSNQI